MGFITIGLGHTACICFVPCNLIADESLGPVPDSRQDLGAPISRAMKSVRGLAFAAVIVGVVACGTSATDTPVPPTPQSQTAPAQTATSRPIPTFTAVPVVISTQPAAVFIRLADPLDEPEYYCLDVPGAGSGVRLDSPLQAHTCKPLVQAADELFTMDQPSGLQIYMPAYDLCVAASGLGAGSVLRLQPCADSPLQRFVHTPDGYILPAGQDQICLAVAPGLGTPTGGPSHLRRDLLLEDCEGIEPSLAQWLLDEDEPGG